MNIYFNIEKLITYAKIHLLLDEANEIYVRNAIMQKLNLSEYEDCEIDEEEIEEYENPYGILDELFAYAVQNGIVSTDKRQLFDAEIMDIVSLRPGEMEDMFESLSKNQAKALEWVCDYAVKNGSSKVDFNRWENKGDKNIEVVFASCCGGKVGYPGCCVCVKGEGYGVHRNERYVKLPFGDVYFKAAKHAYSVGMGNVVSYEHKPMVINEEALNTMFDFIESTPGWFILGAETDCEHGRFICGHKAMPVHKANDKRRFKCKDYQYINVTETDWYVSTLRLSCTNREKLIELALKIIDAFKADGGNVMASVRKAESKFVVELSFMRGQPKKDNGGLAKLDVCALGGIFRIDGQTEARLKTIEKYLTKEIRFTPACLTGGMELHAKMIDRLLKETANLNLGAVEAALDVKEECKKTLVASLNDVKAFSEKETEEFLEKLNAVLVK